MDKGLVFNCLKLIIILNCLLVSRKFRLLVIILTSDASGGSYYDLDNEKSIWHVVN